MTEDTVVQILKEAMILVFKMAGPPLLISMLVGLVIAVLQAATQVHEQTLTFIPKVLTLTLVLLLMSSFLMASSEGFVREIFDLINIISDQTVLG